MTGRLGRLTTACPFLGACAIAVPPNKDTAAIQSIQERSCKVFDIIRIRPSLTEPQSLQIRNLYRLTLTDDFFNS